MEVNFLKELFVNTPKEYDFGIMCSGSVPTTDPNELTPPRRREVVQSLLSKGFTINIISGWGKDRDRELAKCKTILNIQLRDNVKARILNHKTSNEYVKSDNLPVRSQIEIYNYLSLQNQQYF